LIIVPVPLFPHRMFGGTVFSAELKTRGKSTKWPVSCGAVPDDTKVK
jgi:hypothetical protein